MRTVGLVLIYLILLVIISPLLLAFNLQTTVLSSTAPLKNSLAKADAYNRLSKFSAEELTQLLADEERDPESEISTAQMQQILSSIPPETMKRVTEQALDGYFDALRYGRSSLGIDIREIKQKTFGNLPPELKSEVDGSVPDTYQVQISSKNAAFWKLVFNQSARYYALAALGLLIFLAVLLGRGWKGKTRSVGGLILISGIVALASYYLLRVIPLSKLIALTDNASSQKLLALTNDIIQQLLAPLLQIYKTEWTYGLGLSLSLFLLTWVIPNHKATAAIPAAAVAPASTPEQPAHCNLDEST